VLGLFVLGVALTLIGAWTVTHPNGGYRAVGGVGSSFSPSTRRVVGAVYAVLGVVAVLASTIGLLQ
jgi:hypothetical protein